MSGRVDYYIRGILILKAMIVMLIRMQLFSRLVY